MPWFTIGSEQLYFEDRAPQDGKHGETILFAHGAGGNAASWFNQIACFSTNYRCIAFDHRGFGRSQGRAESQSIQQFRADALALLDHLGVDKAHIVGQSMGGYTALRCVLNAPERFLSLTLSCTAAGIALPGADAPSPNWGAVDAEAARPHGWGWSEASRKDPELLELYSAIRSFNINPASAQTGFLQDARKSVSAEMLAAVTIPTLLLCGAEDPVFFPGLVRAIAGYFPHASFHAFENASHSPYIECVDAFNAVLRKHLENARWQ